MQLVLRRDNIGSTRLHLDVYIFRDAIELHLLPHSHIEYCELVAKLRLPETKLVEDKTKLVKPEPNSVKPGRENLELPTLLVRKSTFAKDAA
jgi:hypothetical protein